MHIQECTIDLCFSFEKEISEVLAEQNRLYGIEEQATKRGQHLFELIDKCTSTDLAQPDLIKKQSTEIKTLGERFVKEAQAVSKVVQEHQIQVDLSELAEDVKEALEFFGDAIESTSRIHGGINSKKF